MTTILNYSSRSLLFLSGMTELMHRVTRSMAGSWVALTLGLLFSLLAPALSAQAQTGSVTPHPGWYTCVDMTSGGGNGYAEIHFDVDDPNHAMENLRVEAEGGGITIVNVDPAVGPGQPVQTGTYTIFIQVDELNLCRGRLRILWDERECLGFDETIDVFKQFPIELMHEEHHRLYGSEARITGPECVQPGERVTFSIHPFVSNCPSTAGHDSYAWTLPPGWTLEYNSGDSSSITAIPPANMPMSGQEISVAVGTRCNGMSNTLTLPVTRTPGRFFISSNIANLGLGFLYGQQPINQYADLNEGSIPSDATAPFTLTANLPDAGGAAMSIQWDPMPAGFMLTGGTLTSATITVTPQAPGAAGRFTARIVGANSGCGRTVAAYRINRGTTLTTPQGSNLTYNRLFFAANGNMGSACFDSNLVGAAGVSGSVTVRLINSSAGQAYVWNAGLPSSTYPIEGPDNGDQITIRPTGAVGTGFNVMVQSAPYSEGQTVSGRINISGWQDHPVMLLRNVGSNSILVSAPVTNGIQQEWRPIDCRPNPGTDFEYRWYFVGRFNGVDYNNVQAVQGQPRPPMFVFIPPPESSSATILRGNGNTYSALGSNTGDAYFYVIITSKTNSPCDNKFNCYRKKVAVSISGSTDADHLPPGNGNGDAVQRVGDEPTPVVKVLPNPASGSCQVKLSGPVPAQGKILIYNAAGRQVRALPVRAQQTVRLQGLPRGSYRVVLAGAGKGKVAPATLVIE